MTIIAETQSSAARGTGFNRPWPTLDAILQTPPCSCRWPTLALTHLVARDVNAAQVADPLFHRCPDGQYGRVEVRYWYLRPLNFSCWHCSEGGSVRVVEPDSVVCRHRVARPPGPPAPTGIEASGRR